MKNTFGQSISLTLFGESHGEAIGAVLDGLAPGIPVDSAFLSAQLDKRRPVGALGTARHEADRVKILSGVFEGKTTGTPLSLVIENTDTKSRDYAAARALARPGHADYTAYAKYHGFEDYRGGGHFSGRLTAALVAAGAIVLPALNRLGIAIGSHLLACGGVEERPFSPDPAEEIEALNRKSFAVLEEEKGEAMKAAITAAARDGDSVGGVIETAVVGLPAGLGEPWFDTIEGEIAKAMFSIPAVKGVQFGAGFAFAAMRGSQANDPFVMREGRVAAKTNHNGGVNGGIANGMPLRFSVVVKPTPSIFLPQDTVDFFKGEPARLTLTGRHDPAIVHRARVVVDSLTALTLADMIARRFGTDALAGDALPSAHAKSGTEA